MLPFLVRNVIVPIHEKLLGRKTMEYLRELEELQRMPVDRLTELRLGKLKALLAHAQKNIPFYAKRFADCGFDPAGVQSEDDLRKLPLLTKDEIRHNVDGMTWKECPGGLFRYNTGGSSGKPLIFYFDRRRQAYDAAARALTHRWFGHDVGDPELYLWGSPVEISKQDRIKQLRDWLTNDLLISAFDVSEDAVPGMLAQFRRFGPKCVFGYPSTMELFCQMAHQAGFRLNDLGVRAVFSTAEVLYDHQREFLSEAFGNVPVADCYGSREGGFVSHECPEGSYHVMDPNYVLEYHTESGPAQPGEDGEIVITHLDAWGMPFIRYSTGDVATKGQGACACGRTWSTMSKVRGRTTDFIVTPDGRWQHALSLIYIVRDIPGVSEFKILQEDVDDVRVQVVADDLYPDDGDQRIREGFAKRMGPDVRVQVSQMDDIPRDASGKYRYVVSKVAAKGYGKV